MRWFVHSNSHFSPNFIPLILLIILHTHGMAKDTLLPFQSISVGETLTSSGHTFQLGFFTPPNTTRTYIGIWITKIPQTIVWVANRLSPLSSSDHNASLALSGDGNLRLLDGSSRIVWSSNVTVALNSSVSGFLSETGNFVLQDDASHSIAWDSFQHLCGVILGGLQVQINTTAGQRFVIDTWRSEDDPAPGDFTMEPLPQIPVQCYTWKGSAKYARAGPWNGIKYIGIPMDGVGYTNTWTIQQDVQTGLLSFAVNKYDRLSINIIRLFPDGTLRSMVWNGTGWTVAWENPATSCDVYASCGKNGVCDQQKSPICECLKGFVADSPEEWSKGNWTDGCVRLLIYTEINLREFEFEFLTRRKEMRRERLRVLYFLFLIVTTF